MIMDKQIKSALISVFYKDGLDSLALQLHRLGVTIYSTGGTQQLLEKLNIPCIAVDTITGYPAILGGRVKTLHPAIFGGILGRRYEASDLQEMATYNIPEIDLVIVDLYPFEETVRATSEEKAIIEKIDIGGPSLIRSAAKNFKDVAVIASKDDYSYIENLLIEQNGNTTLEQRKKLAAKAFAVVKQYDTAISDYFNPPQQQVLRYGENPHQQAAYTGDLSKVFQQLHGKELSYNNLVDVDAAMQLLQEFTAGSSPFAGESVFAIIKHNNVCGAAVASTIDLAWEKALAGDPESAFGGVLVTNAPVNLATAEAIQEIFFEVLIAPAFDENALPVLTAKKNRILLQLQPDFVFPTQQHRSLLQGELSQDTDHELISRWEEAGGRNTTANEKTDLTLANILCKHLKSNAIALVKNKQLVGKGCGQTSRIDALRHALEKARQFDFDLNGAVLASDAFFPFNDCVQMGHQAGITAFIQPGGSVRDADSINYCKEHQLAMVLSGMRHFRH
ncbi:MAG: bifunctional phosphoribosylaminoimidazolecarboxamide formyltransferase/IMP cyclohydrolase [Chitinophagaceae bacterium]|nr:bifunctional phosphoribosylaminoimidazolecarboxamide formyltransferase/IMP cyclohydrolase [Chitinophagaceae bacterium]